MSNTYSAQCFCGEVKFEVTGEPVAMGCFGRPASPLR